VGYPKQLRTLGDQLRKRRIDLGLSQRELARQLEVSTSTVENWELDETTPARWSVPRIFQVLELDPPEPTTLRGRLTAYRRGLGLSQGELARSLEVDRCTVVRWETGRTRPTHELLEKFETFLAGLADKPETHVPGEQRIGVRTHLGAQTLRALIALPPNPGRRPTCAPLESRG